MAKSPRPARPAPPLLHYHWLPGIGPDSAALQRMRLHFPLPRQPMGEAWFLAEERVMYFGLMNDNAGDWVIDELPQALEALASGRSCFGGLPEWDEWIHFLLPRLLDLIETVESSELYETLVSALMAHYPGEPDNTPYRGFFDDVMRTLGQCPMQPAFWRNCHIVPGTALRGIENTAHGLRLSCGGTFSAALFLILRFLPTPHVDAWLESVVAIDDPVWRAKLVLWLASVHPLLLQRDKQLNVFDATSMDDAGWDWCWSLSKNSACIQADPSPTPQPFLAEYRRQEFLRSLYRHVPLSALGAWGESLRQATDMRDDCDMIIQQFDIATATVTAQYPLR